MCSGRSQSTAIAFPHKGSSINFVMFFKIIKESKYHVALQQLQWEEQLNLEFANFLHDDILQDLLSVKNMMKNHRLAYALGDAAMSDFISKLKYKAARSNIPLVACGMFEPTSQMCSVCGEINPKVKNSQCSGVDMSAMWNAS